jgi:hypothetical protein
LAIPPSLIPPAYCHARDGYCPGNQATRIQIFFNAPELCGSAAFRASRASRAASSSLTSRAARPLCPAEVYDVRYPRARRCRHDDQRRRICYQFVARWRDVEAPHAASGLML